MWILTQIYYTDKIENTVKPERPPLLHPFPSILFHPSNHHTATSLHSIILFIPSNLHSLYPSSHQHSPIAPLPPSLHSSSYPPSLLFSLHFASLLNLLLSVGFPPTLITLPRLHSAPLNHMISCPTVLSIPLMYQHPIVPHLQVWVQSPFLRPCSAGWRYR